MANGLVYSIQLYPSSTMTNFYYQVFANGLIFESVSGALSSTDVVVSEIIFPEDAILSLSTVYVDANGEESSPIELSFLAEEDENPPSIANKINIFLVDILEDYFPETMVVSQSDSAEDICDQMCSDMQNAPSTDASTNNGMMD